MLWFYDTLSVLFWFWFIFSLLGACALGGATPEFIKSFAPDVTRSFLVAEGSKLAHGGCK